MTDEQFLLANAYHDGELSTAERALAETDPVVMAGVDDLRALTTDLRRTEPPAAAARERAVAAAIAAFHGVDVVPPSGTATSPPQPARRRTGTSRWLSVAAAVVGVGLVGVVISLGTNGSDDDSASMDAPAATTASDERLSPAASELADQESAIAAATVPDVAAAAPSEPAADVMTADDMTDDMAGDMAAEGAAAERPQLVDGQTLTTPDELGAYGTGLLELRDDGVLPATPETACTQTGVLSTASYLLDGRPTDVLVAVDEQRGIVSAIDPSSCALLVEGPLF